MAEKWVVSATGWIEDEDESSHGVNGVFDTLEEAWEASRASAYEDLRDQQRAELDDLDEEVAEGPFVSAYRVEEDMDLETARSWFDGTNKDRIQARQVCTHTMVEFGPVDGRADLPLVQFRQWWGRYYVNRVD